MDSEKIVRHRPLVVFLKAIHGGLGEGNLGLLMSRRGTGKLGVFVSLVVDHALQGSQSLTVAVGKSVADIRAFQDEVLLTLMNSLDLKDRASLMTRVERHRQIWSFAPGTFTVEKLRGTLDFLAEHAQFRPEVVDLTGWPDFASVSREELEAIKAVAVDYRCKLWLAAHTNREGELDARGVPPYINSHEDLFSVLIALEPDGEVNRLHFIKTHDQDPPEGLNLVYDPNTQLLRWR